MLEQKHFRGIEYFCMFICCVLPLARYNMQRLVIHFKKIMIYRKCFYDAHVTTYKLDVFISENEFYSYVSSGKFIFSMTEKDCNVPANIFSIIFCFEILKVATDF